VDSAGLEVLSTDECIRLLSKVPVGRIVYTDRALPAVQPVNFVVDGWSVAIRTAPRSRLATAAAAGTVVAFEVDEFTDEPDRTGWSVVAVGRAIRVLPVPTDQASPISFTNRLTPAFILRSYLVMTKPEQKIRSSLRARVIDT
jgi:nitroimidazol reductase NimA-like FMN-containing flavoprotein (pyridoxamine 5'-phosphate oxidase superfamily)